MYKNFKSNFAPLCEEMVTRMQSGGWLCGDIVKISDSVFKNPKLKDKPSQFFDRIKELQGSDYPLRLCALKTEKPVSSYDGVASAGVTTGEFADVAQMISPAQWVNTITLPVEVLELVTNGNNLPAYAQSQKYDNKEQIKPVEVKIKDKDILKQTEMTKKLR